MTQSEKTEAAIADIARSTYNPDDWVSALQDHARDLARKLDAVLTECDGWQNPTADAIRAIVEPTP